MLPLLAFEWTTARSGSLGRSFSWGKDKEGETLITRMWAVTARHVINNIRKTGVTETYLRMNSKDGQSQWLERPTRFLVSPPI